MKYLLLIILLPFLAPAFAQGEAAITLEACYEWAAGHNPIGRRTALDERANALSIEQLDAARLPNITLNGNAQYQSENVKVPFEIPGQEPFDLPLFVAQAAVDVDYALYDGGAAKARRSLREAELLTERQDVITALSGLKERINALYFTLLLKRARIEILQASRESLRARQEAVGVAVREGAALPSEEAQLRAEMLRVDAEVDREQAAIRTAAAQLSHLTGKEIAPDADLQVPQPGPAPVNEALQREELRTFSLQQQQILAREALIAAARRPLVSAYARGGLGYPNPLNFFDDRISPFGLVGLRVSWRIFDWNHSDLERELLGIQSQQVAVQREVFEFDVQLREEAIQENLASLEQQMQTDRRLVGLEAEILEQKAIQLEQGVATSSEYIDQEARLTTARLQEETHRLQWLKARVDYETEKGIR